jgi:hypothetical protein
MNRGLSEAHKELGKNNPAMSKALSAMGGAVPHLSAMTQGKGLGSQLVNGFKAASAMRKATRELSKMGGDSGGRSGSKSASGAKSVGKPPTLSFRVGEIQTNFGHASGAGGFRDLGGRKGKAGQSPAKNYGIHISFGSAHNSQDQAKDSNGFRESGGRNGKSGTGAKRSPGFQIIIGHQPKGRSGSGQDRSRGGSGPFGAQIHISFARSGGTSSEMAALRVGGLSISMQGASAASHSRKRANAFDGSSPRRKHASDREAFPSLSTHSGSKARHRATPASTNRHAAGFSMTIGFPDQGRVSAVRGGAQREVRGGRGRANTL